MELKKGYKNTEIGVIPEDWELKTLGEICFPSSKRINPISCETNYKCIELEHLSQATGRLIGYSYSKNLKSQKTLFVEDDVLFGKLRPYLRKFYFADFAGVCTTEIWVLKKSLDLFSGWLYYLVQSNRVIDLANQSTGTKMPRAEWSVVGEMTITFPPLPEQTAIAAVLSDTDSLIQALEKKISKKQLIKKGAMQKLFTPKEGWEEKTLGEISEITSAGVDKKINQNEIPVVLLNYMDVYKRDFIFKKELNHKVTAPSNKLIYCNVLKGDIFLTPSSELRTDIGLSALAMEDMVGVVYSYHVYRLRYFIDIDMLFGLYLLKTRRFLEQPEIMCEGSGKRYVVSMGKFKKMEISYPKSLEEQVRIATILSDMDTEIESLQNKLDKYKYLKVGIMQNLLTGKIRLV